MPAGRPQGRSLDPDLKSPVVQGVMEIDARGRGGFPSHLLSQLTWFSLPRKATQALAVLSEPGFAMIEPWDPGGVKVLERRAEFIQAGRNDPVALQVLRKLENRYKRMEILADNRVTFPPEMILHLDMPDVGGGKLFLFVAEDRIELMAKSYRERLFNIDDSAFDDLP